MSFSDLLAGLDEAVSGRLCDPALWTPTGTSVPVAIRVQPEVEDVQEATRDGRIVNTTRRKFWVAEAEFAPLEAAGRIPPGRRPQRNDGIVFAGESLQIFGDPRREGEGRRWWAFEAAKA